MPGPPRPTKKKSADEFVIVVIADGKRYALRPNEIPAVDSAACRRATGMSARGLLEASRTDPDIDTMAALIWLARRQAGEPYLAFEDVAASITYETTFDHEISAGDEDADEGEVPAAG